MPPDPPRLLPAEPILNILPRQPGESRYSYYNRRSVALTGQTLYERRRASGQARGLSVTEARGHAPTATGETEYQRRRRRTLERTGFTPSQLYWMGADQWLMTHGYTPENTGWSQTRLRRRYAALKYIFENSSSGSHITPEQMAEAWVMEQDKILEPGWGFEQVQNRYVSQREWQRNRDPGPGRWQWFHLKPGNPFDGIADNWWYYHG